MNEKVTIYTIAEELNMSPSMVSRAFNPKGRIDEKKRKLVLDTAKKYGYTPNRFASRLSMKRVKIGVFGRSKFDPVAKQLLEGIEKAYTELKDYKIEKTTIVCKTREECEKRADEIYGCDGAIVFGLSSQEDLPILNNMAPNVKNIVQLQSVNEDFECLFSSKHSEKTASETAAEFLYNCLKRSVSKNVILFTGDLSSKVHKNAKEHFFEKCKEYGFNLLECVDMKDREDILEEKAKEVFEKHKDIDGIYITSGNSLALCRYIKENKKDVFLVTFDVYKELSEYIKNSVVSATIFQNLENQGKNAFEKLVNYIVKGEAPEKTIYTNVELVMKSNIDFYI